MPTLVLPDASAWTRRRAGAVLTGSCAALARVLDMPVRIVRFLFVLGAAMTIPAIPMLAAWDQYAAAGTTVLTIGSPFVLGYLCLWWALPEEHGRPAERFDPTASTLRGRPAASAGIAAGPVASRPASGQLLRWILLAGVIGLGLIVAATAVIIPFGSVITGIHDLFGTSRSGYGGLAIAATGVLAAGLALGVLPLDAVDRARWGGRVSAMPRLVLGTLATALGLLVLGAIWLVVILFGSPAALITLAVAVGGLGLLALVLVPWGRHLWLGMQEETEQRALVQQRSEFTAHLHDSVLQTLTLLQKPGTDPDEVRRLARRQERELRRWLYQDAAAEAELPTDVRGAVTAMCGDIEDQQGAQITVVVIGSAALTEPVRPVLAALREATINACRHGGPDVDVFVDVSDTHIEAYVRDHGPGFDLDALPEDRLGVRESIIGRMQRAGGSAHLRCAPGGGTEVALVLQLPPDRGRAPAAG